VVEEERGVELWAWRSDVSGAALPVETSILVALDDSDMQTKGARARGGGVVRWGGAVAGDGLTMMSSAVATMTTEEKAMTVWRDGGTLANFGNLVA
jgi:hypothetical protein